MSLISPGSRPGTPPRTRGPSDLPPRLIAVRVGGQSGVLAVIVHQLVEQGGGVAALPQLAEQILRLSLLLRRGSLVQGLSGLRVLGQQQDVLDGVQLPVVLDVGEQVASVGFMVPFSPKYLS